MRAPWPALRGGGGAPRPSQEIQRESPGLARVYRCAPSCPPISQRSPSVRSQGNRLMRQRAERCLRFADGMFFLPLREQHQVQVFSGIGMFKHFPRIALGRRATLGLSLCGPPRFVLEAPFGSILGPFFFPLGVFFFFFSQCAKIPAIVWHSETPSEFCHSTCSVAEPHRTGATEALKPILKERKGRGGGKEKGSFLKGTDNFCLRSVSDLRVLAGRRT